ncbi:hypothetical protein G7D34_003704 [Salmonella enterica]|nr:hypothetical protein [Salmonella enterica]
MSKLKAVGGSALVAGAISLKFLLKAGVMAAIFGGSHVAANAYAESVMHVKQLAQDFNAKNQDEQIEIEEDTKTILHHVYMKDVSDQEVANIDQAALSAGLVEMKAEQVKHLRATDDTSANADLIRHGWVETYQYETLSHTYITSFNVSRVDL